MTAPQRPKIILDCDPGIDDAFALPVAARYGDLLGITTVGGNASLEAVTNNALLVCQLFGIDAPVHAGRSHPLVGEPKLALEVHGSSGFGTTDLPPVERSVASNSGIEFIIDTVRAVDDVWLVPIGPLTNIAVALEQAPDIASRIAGISFMGGSATLGNMTAAAEFNTGADPEAADVVLRSGVPLRMAGLDLTHQFEIDDDFAARVRAVGSPGTTLLADLTGFILDRMAEFGLGRIAHLHDPVAVLAVTHPDLIASLPREVVVELDGTHTRGMTLVDMRWPDGFPDGNVLHGHTLDAAEAERLVLEALV